MLHDGFVVERAFDTDRVSGLVHLLLQGRCIGKAEDVADVVVLAPHHRLGPRVMPLVPRHDAALLRTPANGSREAARTGAILDFGWRLARPQDKSRSVGFAACRKRGSAGNNARVTC